MTNQALIPADNLQHNVSVAIKRSGGSLRALAKSYFVAEVAGQAKATIDAKQRDLTRFIEFYEKLYGHDHTDEWYSSVTREFVRETAKSGVSAATLARIYASVRRFARWIHKVRPFPLGCPTDGIRPPEEPEPQWKGLARADEIRLLNAAQTLRVRPGAGTNQGLRDHSILAVLLGSGLRVTELINLDIGQYNGKDFRKVIAKGGRVRDFVALTGEARKVLDEYLEVRGDRKGSLFATRSGGRLDRHQIYRILQRMADQANAHRKSGDAIEVSPHVLRHTFLRKVAEQKGVQYAKEASGHKSDRYIWRYVRPNRATLTTAIEELE